MMDEELSEYKQGRIERFVVWQKEHISDRQMTLILAFVIGLLASVAGFFLHGIGARNTVAAYFQGSSRAVIICSSCFPLSLVFILPHFLSSMW